MSLNPRITDWPRQVVWIVGASSGIGRATAHALHARGATLYVSGRQQSALDQFAREHPGASALPVDVTDPVALRQAARLIVAQTGRIDLVMACQGHYTPLRATDFNLGEMLQHNQVNYIGSLNLLDAVMPFLLAARAGHISLVGSVAGYRGLPKALAYGPTKAALINLADVLYLDLKPRGLGVSIINPGFVATALTANNGFQMPALLSPEQAAMHIIAGWEKGRFEVHFPLRFTAWLKALQMVWHGLYFALMRRTTGL